VSAWGDNNGGPLDVPTDLTNAVAVSAGEFFSVALRADGTVVQWGTTNYGITEPPPGITATRIAAGDFFVIALDEQPPPQVTISFISPQSQTVGSGSQAFFSVGASGAPPLAYQWFFGPNAIAGATNRWLALPNALPSQSGLYNVAVSNSHGSAVSQPVSLYVVPSLDITTAPAINVKGEPGSTYQIEFLPKVATTNNWAPLATVTLTNTQQYYCDPSAIGQPARFYRLVQVP
jgi:hypothetical protein